MRDPTKGHAALRRGRVSIPGAEYFLTVCTGQGRVGLPSPGVAEAILSEARAMDADNTWKLRCAVVMPEHIHLLAILGERLSLGKSIARLKSKTNPALRLRDPALEWERDFFDRHVRPDEDRIALFLYIYLNPFRAGLCPGNQLWPWFWCSEVDWAWFKDHLEADRPVPEWLM